MTSALAAGLVALVVALYAASLHVVTGNSDGATVVLEGQSMGAGNVLLHHWSLSLDSFWSVDAVFYMVVVFATGVAPVVLHLVPAVIASLVVVVGSLMARVGYRGVPAVAAAATVFALLALPSRFLAVYFLQGPLHVGTVLWCLLAFAGLRHGRLGWGWALAVALFAGGVLGDFQTAAIGMAPALAAGGLAMVRTRRWRQGVTTAVAPLAALVVAGAVRLVTNAFGTFSVTRAHPTAEASQILPNIRLIGLWGAHMLGVGTGRPGSGGVPPALAAVHVFGVAAVVIGVAVAATGLVRGMRRRHQAAVGPAAWRLDDLLLLGFVADLVVFVTLTYGRDEDFSRYLTAAVVFGSVLGGRAVARLFARVGTSWVRQGCAVLGVCILAAFGAASALDVTASQPGRPYVELGRFLEAHHLDNGVGDYWSASITTVSTGGSVTVRPVIADPRGRIVRYQRQSDDRWYARQVFQFLVYDTALPWGGVTAASASATFGPTARTYDVGTYRVLVWHHPLAVPR